MVFYKVEKNGWKNYFSDIVSIEEISDRFCISEKDLKKVSKIYPFRLPRYFYSKIKEFKDPIFIQAIPDILEIKSDSGMPDPFLEDSGLSPVPNLVHRYDDRVILLASDKCAMYCRHCMRKRRVGIFNENFFDNFDEILNYLKNHNEIEDIIISGGDPLLLSDEKIEFILSGIRKIKKDEILRIHSRFFSTLPMRITPFLCNILKKYHPVYINTHFNHSSEISKEAEKAALTASDYGIPLGCQSVFLKGVNDNYNAISELFKKLLKIRIKPYYLHHPDPVQGTSHLKPSVEKGLEIIKKLRGRISGMAIPNYMIDLPDGGGKVALCPDSLIKKDNNFLFVENFRGKVYKYPLK